MLIFSFFVVAQSFDGVYTEPFVNAQDKLRECAQDRFIDPELDSGLINQATTIIGFNKIPLKEFLVYETNDKGKIGKIEITLEKDSLGYYIVYTSDRIIEVILDSIDLGTRYLNKIVNGRQELHISRSKSFYVNFKGKRTIYQERVPVYDRHTLDFAFRGFEYKKDFKKRIRLHIPEFMIVNADLEVIAEEVVSTPFGEIICWKIKMSPRVIFTRMKFFFWIEKDYPHRFIKYSDAAGKNQILLKKYHN